MKRLQTLALLALFVSLASCASSALEAETLPLHLALIPFERAAPADADGADTAEVDPAEDGLQFDTDSLSRELSRALDGLSFTRVTLLAPPPDVPAAEFARWSEAARDEHWLRAAEAAGADVLLRAALRAAPAVHTSFKGKATPMVLLDTLFKIAFYSTGQGFFVIASFSAAGWSLEDRDARFDVGIEASLQALGPLLDRTSEVSLANRRAELVRVFVYDSDAVLTFHERSGVLGHLFSIFLPGALLPSSGSRQRQSLREAIGEYLTKVLVQELEFRKSDVLRGNGLFPFQVTELRLRNTDTPTPALDSTVLLTTESVDRLDGYRVWVGEELVADAGFEPGEHVGEHLERFHLHVPLPALGSALVRLEIRDGAVRQGVRTFTLLPGVTGRRTSYKLTMSLPAR
jgi:hypothetical protein